VFRGQYLPLSLSKRGVPYIKKKKEKERKRQVQNKKEPPRLRTYPKCGKKNQKCSCPILPSLRTYPILPGLKTGLILLVRSCRSDLSNFIKAANLSVFTRAENWSDLACPFLPDFTKVANLSVFTRAENWSDLACPFCLILPRLITCQFLPGL
jgi:hypothetical protein